MTEVGTDLTPMSLNLTKIAFGAQSYADLESRHFRKRAIAGCGHQPINHQMNVMILGLIAGGAVAGGLASLIPSEKLAIGLLCLIPIAMLVIVHIELSDPNRPPDALDALSYLFGPLWPSIGAFAGFVMGRGLRG